MGQAVSFQESASEGRQVEKDDAAVVSGYGGYDKLQAGELDEKPVRIITQQMGGISLSGNAHISGGIVAAGDVHTNVVIQLPSKSPSATQAAEQARLKKEEAQAQARLLEEVLEWLAPNAHFRTVQSENLEKCADGTLSWFIAAELYLSWKRGGDRIIWGTGIPGAGKTVLASRAIHDLEEHASTTKGKICVIFAYCRYSEPLTVEEILEALVKQFLECDPSLVTIVEPIYSRYKSRQKNRPTQVELLELLQTLETHFEIVFYVVDGLDEAIVKTRFDLIKAINRLRGRFALTSRPIRRLELGLPATKFYEVTPDPTDIVRLVEQKLEGDPGFCDLLDRYGHREELIHRIENKCSGMFLHAALQLEYVYRCETITCIQKSLDRFPPQLEGMYHEAMERINTQIPPENAALAKHVLLWLVFANETLSLYKLLALVALTCDSAIPSEENPQTEVALVHGATLASLCCGLVHFEKKTSLMRLVHFTAREVLAPILSKDFPNPHGLLFRATTSHLVAHHIPNYEAFGAAPKFAPAELKNPALGYSYKHWAYHAREGASKSDSLAAEVFEFLKLCVSYPLEIGWTLERLSPLHVAARYGLDMFVDQLVTEVAKGDVAVRTEGVWEATPLIVAAQYGHVEVIDRLLKLGRLAILKSVLGGHSKPGLHLLTGQINLRDSAGKTALITASMHAQDEAVQRLLQHPDVDVNAKSNLGYTALRCARTEETLDSLLARKDIQVNSQDEEGVTMLMSVSKSPGGEWAVERLLSRRDVKVGATCKKGWTALMYAADVGHAPAIRLLLQHKDARPNHQARDGTTALMLAAENGHEAAVEGLLEDEGIDVNVAIGWAGITALMLASTPGVVSLLLRSKGIRTDMKDKYGYTALTSAKRYPLHAIADEGKRRNHEGKIALLEEFERSSHSGQ
ncbi:ankyrin repeat domain-containing protein 50 [Coprinopsis cinerea AmutBmut pab1-1]|nr:ankyrin repeat domain-containing protein 50 [Coprinopsis cinerea AmutBmut pab1-1]